jgi:hypothetical protein
MRAKAGERQPDRRGALLEGQEKGCAGKLRKPRAGAKKKAPAQGIKPCRGASTCRIGIGSARR